MSVARLELGTPGQRQSVYPIIGRYPQANAEGQRDWRLVIIDVRGIRRRGGSVLGVHRGHRQAADGNTKSDRRPQLHGPGCEAKAGMRVKLHRPIVRKLRRISFPLSVRMDSGWNCTPHTGYSRCLTACISVGSSLARAMISSSSGSESDSTTSEW